MIASSVIRQVEELLLAGRSQRTIARQIGVSRTLVARVAAGEVSSTEREQPSIGENSIPATRCPRCGGLCVEAPCRRCLTESSRIHLRPDAASSTGGGDA